MFKYVNNKKGSSLLMVLIVMVAVTLLGIALISMTVMSTSIKYNDTRSKKSMYYAESGIDQVYALVAKEVDHALDYATSETATHVNHIKQVAYNSFSEIDTSYHGKYLSTDPTVTLESIYAASGNKVFYNSLINPDESAFKDEADATFRYKFAEYFNTTITKDAGNYWANQINTISSSPTSIAVGEDSGGNPISESYVTVFDVNRLVSLNPFDLTKTNAAPGTTLFKITDIKSTIQYNYETEKMITAEIYVQIPDASYPLSIVDNNVVVMDNPIWQNAIVSAKDVHINGSTTIDGDLYAYGHYPAPNDSDRYDYTKFGGVYLKKKLEINGDICSAANIKGISSGTMLETQKSHIYVDSFIAEGKGNILKTDANTNLYTRDDVELNGKNSKIYIDGSYYGYNRGNAGTGHDNSSCIIINEADGTELLIKGDKASLYRGEPYHGIFIYGTSYIQESLLKSTSPAEFIKYEKDALGNYNEIVATEPTDVRGGVPNWPYQTGESVSIKPNMTVYAAYNDGTIANDYTYQKSTLGLHVVVGQNNKPMNFVQKAAFFANSDNQLERRYNGNGTHEDGTGGKIDINIPALVRSLGGTGDRDIYILADYYDDSSSPLQETSRGMNIADGDANIFSDKVLDDYLFYLNTSTHRVGGSLPTNYVDPFTDVSPSPSTESYEILNIIKDSGNDCIDNSVFATMRSMASIGLPYSEAKKQPSTVYPSASPTVYATDIIYLNDDNSPTTYTLDMGDLKSGTTEFQGIVVNYGPIVINGPTSGTSKLKFTGVIMSGSDITVNGNCEFVNPSDESYNDPLNNPVTEYLAKKIAETEVDGYYYLVDLFDNYYDMFSGAPLAPLTYRTKPIITAPSSGTNLEDRYADLITIGKWDEQ